MIELKILLEREEINIYQGEKKIFQYEMDAEGDVYDLLIILKKGDMKKNDSIYERALHRRANDYPENIEYDTLEMGKDYLLLGVTVLH